MAKSQRMTYNNLMNIYANLMKLAAIFTLLEHVNEFFKQSYMVAILFFKLRLTIVYIPVFITIHSL